MKSIFYTLLLGSALMTGMASCTDQEDASSTDKGVAANISAGITSRAVNNKWNENDEIGITMLSKADNKVIAPYTNYEYTTDGSGDFDPNPSDKRIYFPQDGSSVTFKAYYPYSANNTDMTALPVSVASQGNLPAIDLMTAEHVSGDSKADTHVQLHFYHRLAKILVNLTTDGGDIIPLDGCKLVIKGLKTTGSYNLMTETLSVNADSEADMVLPLKDNSGKGIILPRAAGEGVVFEITTADGGKYTATMNKDLEIKAGYKHTFNIVLKKTPIEVSATIEEWIDGPETQMDVVRVVTGLKDNENVTDGSILHLYLKDQADFAHAADYTYTANAWTTDTPIYWESITADPAGFRGTLTYAPKLNDTQMDDLMASDATEIGQYTATNLELKHVGAKATVELKSTDGTFSADDLKGATITFPGYKTSGTINEKGEFVIGTTTGDILATDGVAIFPPQTVKKGDVIAKITINGRDYEIKAEEDGGLDFAQGKNTKLILDLSKSEIEVSTVILEWGDGGKHEFNEVKIGPANLTDNGGDVKDGDQLHLFTGTDNDARTELNGHFTYNEAGSTWNYSEVTPLYWENIASTGNVYASITRPAISATTGNNQLPDYITATPIENKGGTDNTALNFTLSHAVAKVIVILNSKTYTLAQLRGATVILPGYTIGGTLDKGIFKAGTATGNITIDGFSEGSTSAESLSTTQSSAYLQAQEITGAKTVVKITIDGRVYEAKQAATVTYTAGKVTTLTVNIEKSAVNLSANVLGWTDGDSATFNGLFFTTTGSASGFEDKDVVRIFKTVSKVVSGDSNGTYIYSGNKDGGKFTSTSPWYRDDFKKDDGISAVYPAVGTDDIKDGKTFLWACTGNKIDHNQDVMVATGKITDNADIALLFKPVLSKVTVNIFAGDGFTNDDLKGCGVSLSNFKQKGNVNVTDGVATATADAASDFAPSKLTTPYTVDTKKAAASHESFIMPQTIENGIKVVTVTLKDGKYEAKMNKEMIFKAGERGVLNITLAKTGINLQASVAQWVAGPTGDITIK